MNPKLSPLTVFSGIEPDEDVGPGYFYFNPVLNSVGKLSDLRLQYATGAFPFSVASPNPQLSELFSADILDMLCTSLLEKKSGKLVVTLDKIRQTTWQFMPFGEGFLGVCTQQPSAEAEFSTAGQQEPVQKAGTPLNRQHTVFNRINEVLLNSGIYGSDPEPSVLSYLYNLVPAQLMIIYSLEGSNPIARPSNWLVDGRLETDTRLWPLQTLDARVSTDFGNKVNWQAVEPNPAATPLQQALYEQGFRSMVIIPLSHEEHQLGLLLLTDKRPRFFSAETVALASEIANHLTLATYQRLILNRLRQRTEELSEMNHLLEVFVKTAPAGRALFRPVWHEKQITDFTYIFTNPANAAITGLSIDEMTGSTLLSLFPGSVEAGLFQRLVEVAKTGEAQYFEQYMSFDSVSLWGDFSILRVGTDVLFTVLDMTRLKKAEQLLRQQNENLEKTVFERTREVQQLSQFQKAILNYAGLAITVTDQHGVIQLVNPALEELSGYRSEELVGKHRLGFLRDAHTYKMLTEALQKVSTGDSAEELILNYVKGHGLMHRESKLLHKNGQLIDILSTMSGLYDEHGQVAGIINIVVDITSLKSIQRQVEEANRRLTLATRLAGLGIWEFSFQTGKLTWDEQMHSIHGTTPETFHADMGGFLSMVHPDDREGFEAILEAGFPESGLIGHQMRIVRPDGQVVYTETSSQLIKDEQGNPARVLGAVQEHTARRLAELALQRSEERYRSLVDSLNDVVFQTDLEGYFTFLNPAWEKTVGFGSADSLGKSILFFLAPEEVPVCRVMFSDLVQRQTAYCQKTVRFVAKNNSIRWMDIYAHLHIDEHGKVLGTSGTLRDVTEEKQAVEALEKSERRFREIAEVVDDIFWSFTLKQGQMLYVNPAFERVTGLTLTDMQKHPEKIMNLIAEEDCEYISSLASHLYKDHTGRCRVRDVSGKTLWYQFRTFVVDNSLGKPTRMIGVASNITAEMEKSELLEKSLTQEKEVNALKSRFVSLVSHEFRTPMATILSGSEIIEMLAERVADDKLAQKISHFANQTGKEVGRLNTLISEVLMQDRLQTGKLPVKPQALELVGFCREICERVSQKSGSDRVVFNTDESVIEAYLDPMLLEHSIENLVNNGLKYSPNSTQPVEMLLERIGENFRITVTDYGIGIPAEELDKIGSSFYRASNVKGFTGTGLGLSLVDQFVKMQHGTFKITSEVNAFTTCTIDLPLQYQEQEGV